MLHVYMSKKALKRQGPGRNDPYLRITPHGVFLSGPGARLLGEAAERVVCAYDDETGEVQVWADPQGAFRLGRMRSATRRLGGKRLATWLGGFGVAPGKYAARGDGGKLVAKAP